MTPSTAQPTATAGRRPHLVTVQHSVTQPDGDGGYFTTWTDANPPTWFVELTPATARIQQTAEKITAGTVLAEISHIATGPYRPDIGTTSRVLFEGRIFNVTSVTRENERPIVSVLRLVEVIA